MFETGIKGCSDLIQPFLKGGKIGLFGGGRSRKTVLIQELIHERSDATRGRIRVSRGGRAYARG